jgi:hypothetical protein
MLIHKRTVLLSILTLFVFVLSLATPLTAFADDATPPPDAPATETSGSQDNPVAPSEPAVSQDAPASTADPVITQDEAATEPATDEVATEAAGVDPETPTAAPTTLPEVLEQVPEGTEVVVINEDGTPEPLATQEAAAILANGDPYFDNGGGVVIGYSASGTCPNPPVLPANCITSTTPIQAAVNAYNASSTANGPINVEAGTYAENVSIDAASGYLSNLTGLIGEGSGTTTITGSISVVNLSNPFALSGFTVQNSTVNGILIVSSGNVAVDDVVVTGAAGDGAVIDTCNYDIINGICTTSGSVSVTNSQFNTNTDDGLYVDSGAGVTVSNVTTTGNGLSGTELWATGTTPAVNVSNTTHTGNHGDGLDVYTTGTTQLTSVTASQNTYDGTYIESVGDVTITGSTFGSSGAGNGWYGIDLFSAGNVSIDTTSASYNGVGGAYIDARDGTGTIDVTFSQFNSNTGKGLLALGKDGDITLDNSTASNNSITGAYLNALAGSGNVYVGDGVFNSNVSKGLEVWAADGAIQLFNVNVDGGGVTGTGTWLKTTDGGNIVVENSNFNNATGPGLVAISSGTLDLVNSSALNNGDDGAQLYSTYSYACFGPKGIVITVDGGTYQNNGDYGFYAAPGPTGSLTISSAPVFGGNISGDYLLDLSDHCPISKPPEEKPPGKPLNIVDVPATGGTPVAQDCETYSGTLLQLPNGDSSKVKCPFDGSSITETLDEGHLPHTLPTGSIFVSAQSVGLTADGQPVEALTDGATLTINFVIPEGMNARRFSIMFWDPAANNGAGGWVELPVAHFGNPAFPLHPDDPNDPRMILSGVQVVDGKVTVTVNFPGVFTLVAH